MAFRGGAFKSIEGVEDLLLNFDRLDTAINAKNIAAIFQIAGEHVKERAQELVHFKTGELQFAIFARAYVKDGTPAVLIGVESTDKYGHKGVVYAARIEFGGGGHRAFPYLRPASEQTSNEVLQLVANALQQLITGAIK